LKLTATDLKGLGVVDEIVPEPPGGAHVDHEATFKSVDVVLTRQLEELAEMRPEQLMAGRYRKFRNMGRLGHDFNEEDLPPVSVGTSNE
jgi:acetyl-CoA carboxylase carboxyl transferase subunit alpha